MAKLTSFEFATATRIIFGAGALREVALLARQLGQRVLLVTGRSPERAEPLLKTFAAQNVGCVIFSIAGEPTLAEVRRGVAVAKSERCDVVMGFGGGSAVDAGKAIAALLTNGGEVLDYLEVIGSGKPLTRPAAPFIAIPTTAGAGAEVTRNAVLVSPEHRVKVSLRSPWLLARVAVVDPELTIPLPPAITASTGLDALTQLIEPFVSTKANPLADAFCREGIPRVARSLRRAWECGRDITARTDMALASLCGGLALANAGLGAVHGFAAPMGGMFSAPHGAVCAALLPQVMEANLRVLRERSPDDETSRRYGEVARLLTGNNQATADEGVAWVRALTAVPEIPPLRTYGMTANDFPTLTEKAAQASSMKGNPVALNAGELREILARSL